MLVGQLLLLGFDVKFTPIHIVSENDLISHKETISHNIYIEILCSKNEANSLVLGSIRMISPLLFNKKL